MENKRGFTLIELLVVIAIIAILAAILFPVFITVKAKGQQAKCMANMKQLGTALYTYLSDWNDAFPNNRFQDPFMAANAAMDGTRFNWKTALQTTMKTRGDVWRCQTNRNNDSYDETGQALVGQVPEVPRFPISYAYNGDYFNEFVSPGSYALVQKKLSSIRKPTSLLVVVESVMRDPDIHSDFATEKWAVYDDFSSGNKVSGCRIVIHQGKVTNCLFTDTHARAMTLRQTLVPRSMWYQGSHAIFNQRYYDQIADQLAQEAR